MKGPEQYGAFLEPDPTGAFPGEEVVQKKMSIDANEGTPEKPKTKFDTDDGVRGDITNRLRKIQEKKDVN